MIVETPWRSAWRACYIPGMDWEPLTDAELDAMSDAEIAERARSIQKGRVAKKAGTNPLTDAEWRALDIAGRRVRRIIASLQPAEKQRNQQLRRLRCKYPKDRDLVRHMADALGSDRSMVSRIINGSGYGPGQSRAGFRV